MTPTVYRTQQRRAAFASCVGTTIEYYDFYIYATAAALVFPEAFFPALGPVAGMVASVATFAVAFLARPLGAALFGHYGDRIGRKRTLMITLLMMGIGTMLIGLLPTSSSIGVAAPIILVLLRIVQGLAIGGEWAGATLLAAEYAPPRKRGLYAVFPQLGTSLGYAISSSVFLITVLMVGESDTFVRVGWRFPFLLSFVLIVAGLYLRLRIEETPVFRAELDRRATAGPEAPADPAHRRPPILTVFKKQPRELVLGAGTLVAVFALFFIGVTYLTAHAVAPVADGGLGLSRETVLKVSILAAAFFAVATIASGVVSDRLGRRVTMLLAIIGGGLWSLAIFPILHTGSVGAFAVVLAGTLVVVGLQYGPAGALLPELFDTDHRYTGAGLAYNLAAIVGGAIPPLLAPPLADAFGSPAIATMLLVASLISLGCALALPKVDQTTLDAPTGKVGDEALDFA